MTPHVASYRDLQVWQKAMDLAALIYQSTDSFPSREAFGLTSQLRRAAVSVPSNIAEGQSRKGTGEFVHFLFIARASLAEIDTQILLAQRFGFLQEQPSLSLLEKITEIQKMLYALIDKLGGHSRPPL